MMIIIIMIIIIVVVVVVVIIVIIIIIMIIIIIIIKEKPALKVTWITQISEFCNKIMHTLTWNRAYIYNKI